jgi:hypothetical protein
MADSTESYSFISDSDLHSTIYTPTETDRLTDDFEILSISPDEPNPRWDLASTCSTSVLTSAYEHEYAYGRRYHGYKSGRYPMPNDTQEQQREDTIHAMMMELTVCRTEGQIITSLPYILTRVEWPIVHG